MKKLKYIQLYLAISISLFGFSCKKDGNRLATKTELLPSFSHIEALSTFDIFLIQDTISSIKIEAANKMMEGVEYYLTGDTLYLKNEAKRKWLNPENNKVAIYISCNNPARVILRETCMLKTVNAITSPEFGLIVSGKLNQADLELNCNTFYFWNHFPCSGKILLRGQLTDLKLWNGAIMSVDARNAAAQNVLIETSSKGHCYVNAANKIEYKITGTGNIYLYGNPSTIIENELSSSGRLIKQ